MQYSRGRVVLVLFPNSNLKTAKRRPAVVVQSDKLQTGITQTIVAMISSNLSRANHPSRVLVLQSSVEGLAMGLHSDSIVLTDNIATILDSEIDCAIGNCLNM